jgi:hypothetical protein
MVQRHPAGAQVRRLESFLVGQAAYRDNKSRAAMEFSIAYRDRFKTRGPFSGQANPKLDTRWFVAGMTLMF